MATHSLIGAFKANKPAFGAWLTTPGIFHARTVAQASPHLSWIVVDCEHGLVPLLPGAAECIIAIHGAVPNGAPSAIVRIPATGVSQSTSWQIKYALDAGARGVLVPMVRRVNFLSSQIVRRLCSAGFHRREGAGDCSR
jgi:4-hydroxy-2-oxoheptanedioate aldolase